MDNDKIFRVVFSERVYKTFSRGLFYFCKCQFKGFMENKVRTHIYANLGNSNGSKKVSKGGFF